MTPPPARNRRFRRLLASLVFALIAGIVLTYVAGAIVATNARFPSTVKAHGAHMGLPNADLFGYVVEAPGIWRTELDLAPLWNPDERPSKPALSADAPTPWLPGPAIAPSQPIRSPSPLRADQPGHQHKFDGPLFARLAAEWAHEPLIAAPPLWRSFRTYTRSHAVERCGWPLLALESDISGPAQLQRDPPLAIRHGVAFARAYSPDPTTGAMTFELPLTSLGTLPLRPLWPGFALNTAIFAGALWLVVFAPRVAVRTIRGRWEHRRNLCTGCGYARGGLPSPQTPCPECGRASTPPTPPTAPEATPIST